jgi:tRNA threonylcarbamoyladenosine biosynthesis protein TsaE
MMELTFSLSTIHENATEFWNLFSEPRVIAFYGEMGAGKTTFIHALCDVKGVKDRVGSPTFSIINEYEYSNDAGSGIIFHLDLYRLKNEEEAIQAGVEDCLYSGEICFVEWPEKAEGLLPENTLHVSITPIDSSNRKLTINTG